MKLVIVSDTHTYGPHMLHPVPDGDVLIHCGDLTFRGVQREVRDELAWLSTVGNFSHRIFIAGNHDFFFDTKFSPRYFRNWVLDPSMKPEQMLEAFPNLTYLEDSGIEIHGVKFWGSPWTPAFYGWAFNLAENQDDIDHGKPTAEETWAKIPDDTNVLITHGPPHGILDSNNNPFDPRKGFGCPRLYQRVCAVRPLVHAFGHIHGDGGGMYFNDLLTPYTRFINAAINTEEYHPVNAPMVVDI